MYSWEWNLAELQSDKDIKVFSTFSCGGGSTMGYKRAGFQVLGNVEIDAQMNELYKKNHHPKYNYEMDLRDFNKKNDLPDELYQLDILDGSPPCSTFSTAGLREKAWGKEKKFREGQKYQTLDDLFFVFLDTVEKLKPKVVIAENVTGIIKGNAKGYVAEIVNRFHKLGYDVQIFQLNAATMNVPQQRERVFFIANNQGYPKLKLNFKNAPIAFGKVRSKKGVPYNGKLKGLLTHYKHGDRNLSSIAKRQIGKASYFNATICADDEVHATLTSGGRAFRAYDFELLSNKDIINISTFPQDYDFGTANPKYVCGMCVPPNMMANIANEVYRQWLK